MYTSWKSFSNVLERKIRHSTHGKECCTTCEQQTKDFFFHFPLRKNSTSQLHILTQVYWFCVWTVPLQIPKYGFVQDDAKANQQKLCVGKVFGLFLSSSSAICKCIPCCSIGFPFYGWVTMIWTMPFNLSTIEMSSKLKPKFRGSCFSFTEFYIR